MRKIFAVCALIFAYCGKVFAVGLPDEIGEWHKVSENVTPLITEYNGESHGRITYRTYKRESPSAFLEVILTEGKGTGSLYVPESVNTSKGMMPSDSGFEVVKVSGHDAIIESQSYMPLVLAATLSRDIILTVETFALDEKGIIDFTENMIKYLSIQ
ncbi:MAG: hypothetical protein IJQ75_02205 [Synergistaceae bacterium]|nr:hypothetical protein [Synergistaceae bacterium]